MAAEIGFVAKEGAESALCRASHVPSVAKERAISRLGATPVSIATWQGAISSHHFVLARDSPDKLTKPSEVLG